MSEILDDMFDEALKLEQENDEHCGEIVIQSSEFCALHARINDLEDALRMIKANSCFCNSCSASMYAEEALEARK